MTARYAAALRDIYDDIRARPGRAGLSFLAIAVGMTALTVLLAVLGGLAERSRRIVGELGVNVFAVVAGPADTPEAVNLQPRHLELLAAQLPECRLAGTRAFDVSTPGQDQALKVVATQDSLPDIRQWTLREGRFLDALDLRDRERTAVISAALADRMDWRVGSVIQLRDTPFRVAGIVNLQAGALDGETRSPGLTTGDRVVWVPLTLPPYWLTSRIPPVPQLDAIFIRVPEGRDMAAIIRSVSNLLEQPDTGSPSFALVTPDVLLEKVRRLQRTIRFTVGSIALLCLVLGGTTLMSLMVANVRDRVTEIGLRRALGATRPDIALLFVLEAVVVTLLAALAGSLGTLAVLHTVRAQFPVPLALGWTTVAGPVLTALTLGTLFSYAPARAAARISPAEALRNE